MGHAVVAADHATSLPTSQPTQDRLEHNYAMACKEDETRIRVQREPQHVNFSQVTTSHFVAYHATRESCCFEASC